MELSKIQIVQLLSLLLMRSDHTTFATENEITVERLICTKPSSKMQSLYCSLKYISRTNMKIDVHWNLTSPVEEAWLHGVFYHKFNGLTYHKYPIDLWENICDWLSGKDSFILDFTVGKLLKYSNLNHLCPFNGYLFAKADNVSIERFPLKPLLPSGKYRIDLTVTESKPVRLCEVQLYFSVSDHRLEVI